MKKAVSIVLISSLLIIHNCWSVNPVQATLDNGVQTASEAIPEVSPEATPEATATPTAVPVPVTTPNPTPGASPAPTPKLTPKPTPKPTPKLMPKPTPKPVPSPTPKPATPVPEVLAGNSIGNVTNGGKIAVQGDWIYYSNPSDGAKLYREKTNGKSKKKLSNIQKVRNICVINGWVYFCDPQGIYRVKTDGTAEGRVFKGSIKAFSATNKWLYAIQYHQRSSWQDDQYSIIRIDLSGKQLKNLTNKSKGTMVHVCFTDGWLYYSYFNAMDKSSMGIYRMKPDGTGKVKLVGDEAWDFDIYKGYIYYQIAGAVTSKDGQKLYRVGVNGKDRKVISNKAVKKLNISNGWIYYVCYENGNDYIYKVKTDGKSDTRIFKMASYAKINALFTMGSEIFFMDGLDTAYRMNNNGAGCKVFAKGSLS